MSIQKGPAKAKRESLLREMLRVRRFIRMPRMRRIAAGMKVARGPIRGYVTTVCYWALMEIGLIDALSSRHQVLLSDFASKNDLSPEILTYVVRYLVRRGHMQLKKGMISFTNKGRRFWKCSEGVLNVFAGYEPFFSSLVAQLRKEVSFENGLYRKEKNIARGFSILSPDINFVVAYKLLKDIGAQHLVELGCNAAEFSIYHCLRSDQAHCLGIDISPEFLVEAKQRTTDLNLSNRIQLLEADMFHLNEVAYDYSPYDTVVSFDLFHNFRFQSDDKLIALFKSFKKVFKNKKFFVSEILLPPEGRIPRLKYPYAEHELFHDLTMQKTFCPGELESLLQKAGYTVKKTWPYRLLAARQFIYAE